MTLLMKRLSVHCSHDTGVPHASRARHRIGGDPHRMHLPLQFPIPEREELPQLRLVLRDVHGLPNVALQNLRMIRQTVKDLGGGQAIVLDHDGVAHVVRTLSPDLE